MIVTIPVTYSIRADKNGHSDLFRVDAETGQVFVGDKATNSNGGLIRSRRRYTFGVGVTDGVHTDSAEVTLINL